MNTKTCVDLSQDNRGLNNINIMATRKFGIAIVGLGRMGCIHSKNLVMSGRAKVKWMIRNDLRAARKFADRFDSPPTCVAPSQLDLVLNDSSVDGVIICSTTSAHEEQITSALEAGKCVFSEKPITPGLVSTRACYELAERKQKPLFCAFHRRFDPSFLTVRQHLRAQTSGPLRLLRLSSHDHDAPTPHYVKNSGGIFKDSTIHDMDMALWMTGSPVTQIYAAGHAIRTHIRECGDFDLVVITIRHENGVLTVIDNGRRCAHGYDQRMEALCEDGSYVVSNRATHLVHSHTSTASNTPGIDQTFNTRYTDAYANEMEHFLDIMAGEESPCVTKSDTLEVMELAEAAMESAKSGKPVHLNGKYRNP